MRPDRQALFDVIDELSVAELSAVVLDGELVRVGGLLVPSDAVGLPSDRAVAVMNGLSGKLIAEQWTAAWIWGATATPPMSPQFCSLATDRARLAQGGPRVREVRARPDELAVVGGRLVTTPARTLVDLARCSPSFPLATMRVLRDLGGVDIRSLLEHLEGPSRLPGKKQAMARLRPLTQPELTR